MSFASYKPMTAMPGSLASAKPAQVGGTAMAAMAAPIAAMAAQPSPLAGSLASAKPAQAGGMAGDKLQRLYFPEKPESPTYCTCYPTPRWLYLQAFFFWSGITIFRWTLLIWAWNSILYWNGVDCVLVLLQGLWISWHLLVSHHRWRYIDAKPYGDITAKDITHVLCVLHATEQAQTLYNIVSDLKETPCEGKKVLCIGMEKVTPDVEVKMAKIMELYGDGFEKVLYTVHTLRDGEIVGTGSNHYECQVCVEKYFLGTDTSNVIFSKFDCNMRFDKDKKLLQEMEAVWCHVDPETRFSITFMPNLYWSADKPDYERGCMEKFTSFSMNTLLQQSSFAMAFVSGSLDGVCAVGYTPPSLLAEDDLTFSKKQALLPKPRTYRLCSCILKVFDSKKDEDQKDWTCAFLDKKMKRWMMGHVEKDTYFMSWLFCQSCCLDDFADPHPSMKNKCRSFFVHVSSFIRLYLIFAVPLNVMPFTLILGRWEWNQVDFNWFTIFTFLPSWLNWSYEIPVEMSDGSHHAFFEEPDVFFVFFAYWCLIPSMLLCIWIFIRIQMRVYNSFEFLRFSCTTLLLYPLIMFPLLLIMGPLFLLYSYLRHGILNTGAGHVAMAAKRGVTVDEYLATEATDQEVSFLEDDEDEDDGGCFTS